MAVVRLRTFGAAVKIAAVATSTAASTYLALVGTATIKPHPVPVGLAVGSLGAISLLTSVRAVFREAVKERLTKQHDSVRQQLHAAMFSTATDAGVDVRDLTASLFVVRGHHTWQRLERDMRIAFRPRTVSTVRWSKGKGAIGLCWQQDRVIKKNIELMNQQWSGCTQDEWDNDVQDDARMGMSYQDWNKTQGKYDMIIAVPLLVHGRFVGCVALDGPANGTDWVENSKVREALEGAAATIARTLEL